MRKWKLDKYEGAYIVKPTIELKCPFCGERLLLHAFHTSMSRGFYHVDVDMKCSNCSGFFVFGVPITKGEYDILSKSRYNNYVFRDEIIDLYDDIDLEEIKSRLKSWSYW